MSNVPWYLLALYVLGHRRDPPIQTSAVAEKLDRSPASVSEMFRRLEDEGYVTYEYYEGVTLTESGRERAGALHETYVTVSWFFRSELDLEDHEAEAIELAWGLSPSVAERLAAKLPTESELTAQFEGQSLVTPGTTVTGNRRKYGAVARGRHRSPSRPATAPTIPRSVSTLRHIARYWTNDPTTAERITTQNSA